MAARWPRTYRLAVWGLTVFGVLAMPAMMLSGLAVIAATLYSIFAGNFKSDSIPFQIILLLVGGYWVYYALRAMVFPVRGPIGVPVRRDDAAEFWRVVDELCRELRSRRIHGILLNAQLSAAIIEHPRRGFFFGCRNYLQLGLPMMFGTTPEQFRSVLAHELGHLSRRDGRLAAWVYRFERMVQRINEQFDANSKHPLGKFLRWYAPRYSANTVVLRRQQEFRADATAVGACGVDAAGDALIMAYLRDQQHSDFWDEIWRGAASEAYPTVKALALLQEQFSRLLDESRLRRELGGSLARRTSESSSHPALADRLEAMGYLAPRGVQIESLRGNPAEVAQKLPLPTFQPPSAAAALLGDALDRYADAVTEDWAIFVAEKWRNRNQVLLRDQGQLQIYEKKAELGTITAQEAFRRALITESLHGTNQVAELAKLALDLEADHAAANYLRGRLLIKDLDESGVALLERAMQFDPDAVVPGCQLLHEFYTHRNDHTSAERIIQRHDRHVKQAALMYAERRLLPADAPWSASDLPRSEVDQIVSVCHSLYAVKRAYLLRRKVTHFPIKPCYALVVIGRRWPWWKPYNQKYRTALSNEVIGRLSLRHGAHVFVLRRSSKTKALRKRLQKDPALCIYDAARPRGW